MKHKSVHTISVVKECRHDRVEEGCIRVSNWMESRLCMCVVIVVDKTWNRSMRIEAGDTCEGCN